jgi:hypothetical protein
MVNLMTLNDLYSYIKGDYYKTKMVEKPNRRYLLFLFYIIYVITVVIVYLSTFSSIFKEIFGYILFFLLIFLLIPITQGLYNTSMIFVKLCSSENYTDKNRDYFHKIHTRMDKEITLLIVFCLICLILVIIFENFNQ